MRRASGPSPGLTGYAQVNGFRGEIRDTRGMSDRVAADNSYIEEWSPALDLAILARTVPLIFRDPQRLLNKIAAQAN